MTSKTYDLTFNSGFFVASSKTSSVAYQVNCFTHYLQRRTKFQPEKTVTLQVPNIDLLVEIPTTGEFRGWIKARGYIFIVKGSRLIRMDSEYTFLDIGEITGSGLVELTFNGYVIVILVPKVTAYFYSFPDIIDPGLIEIVDPNFDPYKPDLLSVTFKDGYFVFATNEIFFIGSLVVNNNGRDFGSITFTSAETKPDYNVKIVNFRNELMVFGEESIETFDTSEEDDPDKFPFARSSGGSSNLGISSISNVIISGDSIYFLGKGSHENYSMYMGDGVSIKKISHSALDWFISFYSEEQYKAVSCFSYMEEGILFVGWNFPDITIVFDVTNSTVSGSILWHLRAKTFIDIGEFTRYPVEQILRFGVYNICTLNDSDFIGDISRLNSNNYYPTKVECLSQWLNYNNYHNSISKIFIYTERYAPDQESKKNKKIARGRINRKYYKPLQDNEEESPIDVKILSASSVLTEPILVSDPLYKFGRYEVNLLGDYKLKFQLGFSYETSNILDITNFYYELISK